MPATETIAWQSCDSGLPDAELNVLLYSSTHDVLEGFLDGEDDDGPVWRDVTAVQVPCVTHWAEMPEGPHA